GCVGLRFQEAALYVLSATFRRRPGWRHQMIGLAFLVRSQHRCGEQAEHTNSQEPDHPVSSVSFIQANRSDQSFSLLASLTIAGPSKYGKMPKPSNGQETSEQISLPPKSPQFQDALTRRHACFTE